MFNRIDPVYPEFLFNDLGFLICFMILSCVSQYKNEAILGLTRSFQHIRRTCCLASFIQQLWMRTSLLGGIPQVQVWKAFLFDTHVFVSCSVSSTILLCSVGEHFCWEWGVGACQSWLLSTNLGILELQPHESLHPPSRTHRRFKWHHIHPVLFFHQI